MSSDSFRIYKSHGGTENFSREKLCTSLKHAGLPDKQCQLIADKVTREIGEGSKTRDIYRKTLRLVNETSHVAAIHYSLKRALFELGPMGHHFEIFVGKYFEDIGYTTQIGKTLNGRLVTHEVDVIGLKNGKRVFVECKFHNRMGIKNDVKITLYVKARWDDLKEGPEGKNLEEFYLASNTAFSQDAITYAKGSGLKLLGVNVPVEKPFMEEIKSRQLYPITSLKSLKKALKHELISKNIILARDLPGQMNLMLRMGMKTEEIDQLLYEIEMLKGNNL